MITFLFLSDVLNIDTDSIKLEKALNDLPTIYPERVSVTASDITGGKRFIVTFNSELGKYSTEYWMLSSYVRYSTS